MRVFQIAKGGAIQHTNQRCLLSEYTGHSPLLLLGEASGCFRPEADFDAQNLRRNDEALFDYILSQKLVELLLVVRSDNLYFTLNVDVVQRTQLSKHS